LYPNFDFYNVETVLLKEAQKAGNSAGNLAQHGPHRARHLFVQVTTEVVNLPDACPRNAACSQLDCEARYQPPIGADYAAPEP